MLERILNDYNSLNKKNKELEIRLGNYSAIGFQSQVSENIVNYLNSLHYSFSPDFVSTNTIEMYDTRASEKIKKILYFDENLKKIIDPQTNKIKTSFIKKTVIQREDITKKNIRVSLASENEVKPIEINVNFLRYKQRKSRLSYDNIFRLDITKVYEFNIKNTNEIKGWNELKDNSYHYEVEIEIVGESDQLESKLKHQIYFLENLMNPIFHIHRILQIQKPFPFINFNHLTNQTISLDFSTIGKISRKYCVTEKIDGERKLMLIHKNNIYVIDSKLKPEYWTSCKNNFDLTLLDGEWYKNKFYVFDILIKDQISVIDEKFEKRREIYEKIVNELELKYIVCKEFLIGDNIYTECRKILTKDYEYPLDGLIFTPLEEGYFNDSYKWKPVECLTIDFLVKKNIDKYDLYVGIDREYSKEKLININYDDIIAKFGDQVDLKENYVPIIFAPDNDTSLSVYSPIDGDMEIDDSTIVEFKWNKRWIPIRSRPDKTKMFEETKKIFGNDYKVAWNNWYIIQNPITKEMIMGENKYFQKSSADSKIVEIRKFNNKVKTYLYKSAKQLIENKKPTALELAGGRGGDLWKLAQNGFNDNTLLDLDKNALFIDSDCARARCQKVRGKFSDFSLKLVQGDFTQKLTLNEMYDLISCHFSIHYAFGSIVSIDNFVDNVKKHLKPKGIFVVTFLDGERVFNYLDNQNYIYSIDNTDCIKIIKEYNRKKFVNVNQSIKVYIDSIGENKEFLVNSEYLVKKMKEKNINLVEESYFESFIEENEIFNESELKFIEFHKYIIFQSS